MSAALDSCLYSARQAWGNTLPDWIEALAMECDDTSQRKTGAALGLSPATINLLVNNKYAPRNHAGVESVVRRKLLAEHVSCPVLGDMPLQRCRDEQAAPLNVHNPLQLQLYRACRRKCRHFQIGNTTSIRSE